MENTRIEKLVQATASLREELVQHPVYASIRNAGDLKIFMQHHVFAVWDFMSLLKTLQQKLTCTQVPWFPTGNADTRFLVNEIVTGEESDVDENGVRTSHFELYQKAMVQAGAPTDQFNVFMNALRQGKTLREAFDTAHVLPSIRTFVQTTFDVIATGKPHVQAAVFTFGREELIPGMFMRMVQDLSARHEGNLSTFTYYLERHIEVDGDHHGKLALQMTQQLCGDDNRKWNEAEEWVIRAMEARKTLWNGIMQSLPGQAVSA